MNQHTRSFISLFTAQSTYFRNKIQLYVFSADRIYRSQSQEWVAGPL